MKLVVKNFNVWFTSDTHYNHSNICSATTKWDDNHKGSSKLRMFNSLEDMNQTLVNNINDVVNENDYLFHLGDFSFGGFDSISEFRNQINCKNVILILGNHDHHIQRNKHNVQKLFLNVYNYLELDLRIPNSDKTVTKHNFILFHYPINSWPNLSIGYTHLHGHVHLPKDKRLGQGKSLDVGVDGNDLRPISLNEVLDIMQQQPINCLNIKDDHHID